MATTNTTLPARVRRALDNITELTGRDFRGERLVVGVSGGADSVALLHALHALWPPKTLVVAHFDHGLRPDSAADAAFVQSLAAGWSLPYRGGAADVAALAAQSGQGVEEAGRLARYRYLSDVMKAQRAAAVVTGHNADDQAETVLMHILRGSGLAGLRGMLPAGPLPTDPDGWLLRPLLAVSRADIEAYCRDHDLPWLTDATNADTSYYRNRLRHEVLPILEAINPRINQRLQQLADTAAADYDLLETLTDEALLELVIMEDNGWLLIDRATWSQLPLSIRRSTLRSAHRELAAGVRDFGFRTLEAARLAAEGVSTGPQISLPGGVTLYVLDERLLLTTLPTFPPPAGPQLLTPDPVRLKVPGRLDLADGWVLKTSQAATGGPLVHPDSHDRWVAYVDVEEGEQLVVRGRQAGERMQPLGLDGHSTSLKKMMIDRKIPQPMRANWPIVATDHPVWLVGHVLDERHRVTPNSQRVVHLECALETY